MNTPGNDNETQLLTPIRLDKKDAPAIVSVFCDAFYDYPVMRFVLGESADYDERLKLLIGVFVVARVLREEPLLGIRMEGALCAAATMSHPQIVHTPPEFADIKEHVWSRLGTDALRRYEQCTAAWEPLAVEVPQIHLNMIGVRREQQGLKLGRRLLEAVQQISRETPGSQGVSLTTELAGNVRLYEHIGYQVTGHVVVAPGLETWALFRHN